MRRGILKNGDIIEHCSALVANAGEYVESSRLLQDENNLSVIEDEIILADKRTIRRFSAQVRDAEDNYLGRLFVFGDITHPKQIEQLLRESEEKYHQLFFNSPAVRILVNQETGDIVDVNKAAIIFYGYTAKELRDMKIYDINIGDQETVYLCMQSVKQPDGNSFFFKHRLSSGEIRDVEVYSGLVDIAGKGLISSIIFDVTDKLQAEEDLHESRKRLSLVIEGAKAGIWDWDMVNNRVHYDKQWKAILGYEEQEISCGFEEWRSRWHPEDAVRIEKVMRHYLEGKTDKFQLEHRLQHKDGSYRWIFTTGKITRNRKGVPIRWVGSNIDVTIHKEVEELRLESDRRLKDFAQAMPDISFIIDEDGRHLEVFGNNEQLLPVPREELRGLTLHQVFPKELADTFLYEVRQTISTATQRNIIREIDLGQYKRCIEWRAAPMSYLVNGKKTIAVSLTDISERLKAERMLQLTYDLQRKSDFFNDIISGSAKIDEKVTAAAREWGIDLSLPLFCCLINIERAAGLTEKDKGNLMEFQFQKNIIIDMLGSSREHVIWDNRDNIGVLCQAGDNAEDRRKGCIQAAAQLKEKTGKYDPGLVVIIGISDIHDGPEGLKKSYQEARIAILSAKCRGEKSGGVYHYRDIGLDQLLAAYGGKEDAAEYVRKKIGPLINYDRQKGASLLPTLEAILHSSSLKEASQKIFLHYKTLVFRKQRIEKILGVSIDQFDTKLALAAAIKLHKLNILLNDCK
ncbi:sensory box histidine kinase/response regulator [Desulfocucumis palustris]|uniref:histidine kinase n=2 Tax=Desulfocucumis palustris TaxID=1898651 RepID=A0A2L2XHA3_9FIRM|nr:sensory box histidine kinase/response regulator [Desulfocucumis palustris]